MGEVLSQPGEPREAMRRVAREVGRAFGADMVGIYALNAARDALVPMAGYRVPKHLLERFLESPFRFDRMSGMTAAWRAGRAMWASDVTNDPRFDPDFFKQIDPHSVLFAPIAVRGEPHGALFLVWWGAGRQPLPAEISLIEGLAAQVGLSMENLELSAETARKLQETETLLAMSRTLSSTLDLDEMPRQFLRHVTRSLSAGGAGIWLLDETGEWLEPFMGYHVPKDRLAAFQKLRLRVADHPFYAEAARTLRPMVSTDVSEDPRLAGRRRRPRAPP